MTKKIIRPFWSYEIDKTEAWLNKMALDGFVFTQLCRKKRQFTFKKQKSTNMSFSIAYNESPSLPSPLAQDNWTVYGQYGEWTILANEKEPDLIRTYPARDRLYKRNRLHYYGFGTFLFLCGTSLFMQFLFLLLTFFIVPDKNITIVASPLWILTAIFGVCVLSIIVTSIISMRKIRAFEKKNSMVLPIPHDVKIFKKHRFAWVYSPDRLEAWLEKMALDGKHLVKVGRFGGNFHFIHGKPKRMAYVADYQLSSDPDYFPFHQDNGWIHIFSTNASITKWTIWAKEYAESEEKPQLYYDRQHLLAHAKKVFYYNSALILFLFAVNTFNMITLFNPLNEFTPLTMFSTFCMLLSNILVIIMGVKSGLYYARMNQH
ncbi:DUF2812 domain-containing protein [Bacillus sp. FJAT-50079]|uniref:DUF2812 domain-containing protein n=1 Tax=Bacillus sp. FJAT-50079 TaxID=2833577 RepID=UPI001BC9CCED|nr:DUF2812 domain-containing protein [Bacillus sp. FJAT-50079]MBS4209022.1 DUF2812 domain-containing protein [Bacillus sp. FJAT-50079]